MDLYFPENAIDSVNGEDIKHQINENAEAFSGLGNLAVFRIDTEYTDVIQVLNFKGIIRYLLYIIFSGYFKLFFNNSEHTEIL